jgi:hypothetical protein
MNDFFKTWKLEIVHLGSNDIHGRTLLRASFQAWRREEHEKRISIELAAITLQNSLERRYFSAWRKNYREIMFFRYFSRWIRAVKYKRIMNQKNSFLLGNCFEIWNSIIRVDNQKVNVFCMKRFEGIFAHWLYTTRRRVKIRTKLLKAPLFKSWKTAVDGNPTEENTKILKMVWKYWMKRHTAAAFYNARKMIFAETWAEKQMKRKILNGWYRVTVEERLASSEYLDE